MAIIYLEEEKLFHLTNGRFSMYIKIHEDGAVLSPYFGKYLSKFDYESYGYMCHDWYSYYFDRKDKIEKSHKNLWENSGDFLVPSDRYADSRPSLISVKGFENNKLDFVYFSHRMYKGKPKLSEMPFVRDEEDEAETLEITVKDKYKDIKVVISLSIFEKYDCVIRNTTIKNDTDTVFSLERAMSITHDFDRTDFDLIHFPGIYALERQFRRESLSEGDKVIQSNTGRSSHEHNPFVMLADKDANETHGDVYAFSIMYSGSFKCNAYVGCLGVTRFNMGINDECFSYCVNPGESFVLPEGISAYSANGFGNLSRNFHDLVRNNIVKENNAEAYRSILLNSWEGCYLDFDTKKVLGLIRSAKDLGVGLFVLDDGWFGERNDDCRSLGDWFVNKDKVDLKRVIDECHACGMKFGLWFEPEMGNFNSELLKKHPEYAAVDYDTDIFLNRHQVALNFADDNVVNEIYNQMSAILSSYDIDYVKWDHNRTLEDCYAQNLGKDRQGEFHHRNTLGYYRLAKMLTERFDNIHFQGCASGGGRFDLGTLFYFSDIWTSDENNPVQRLFIQYGTSFAYPPSVMGAHVNNNSLTSYRTKAQVALFGSYGFELDPRSLKPDVIDEIKAVNEIYKKYHDEVVLDGDLYRLISPFDKEAFAINMVSKDKTHCLFLFVNLLKRVRSRRFVRLQGLDPRANYRNDYDKMVHTGDYYMNVGLNLSHYLGEFASELVVLERVL